MAWGMDMIQMHWVVFDTALFLILNNDIIKNLDTKRMLLHK